MIRARLLSRSAVATFAILAFVSLMSAPRGHAGLLDRIEANVNDQVILLSEVDRFRKTMRLRSQLDPLFAGTELAKKGLAAPPRDVVDFLIEEMLISQAFPTSEAEAEQELSNIQASNRMTRDALRRVIEQEGFDFQDYFDLIRRSTSKKTLIDREIRTKVSVSEDDLKNAYFNRSNPQSGGRQFKLGMITVTLSNYKSPAAAKEVATRAHQALLAGEAFGEVARRHSDDPLASSGGDLGLVGEDQLSPAILSELKNLKIGAVSGVFGGSSLGGFKIVKLNDLVLSDPAQFERVKEELRANLLTTEFQRQVVLWLERQRAGAYIRLWGSTGFGSK